MKTSAWLAGVAGVALCLSPALAADQSLSLACGAPTQYLGKTGTNPPVRIVVSHDYANGSWSVGYTLADGTPIYRESQYSLSDATKGDIAADKHALAGWIGTLNRQPNLGMSGAVMTIDGDDQNVAYAEWLYDNNQRDANGIGKLVMHSVARCSFTHLPDAVAHTPAPTVASARNTIGEDSIGLTIMGDHAQATVTVGDQWAKMTIDTGASEMSVVEGLAQKLLANGDATTADSGKVTLANGVMEDERRIVIKTVKIGNHELHDVPAGIVPDGTMMLLPFPVLNMVGRFTIDTVSSKLIFG